MQLETRAGSRTKSSIIWNELGKFPLDGEKRHLWCLWQPQINASRIPYLWRCMEIQLVLAVVQPLAVVQSDEEFGLIE